RVPRPRKSAAPRPPTAAQGASPPHLAGTDELGDSGDEPDWWRIEPGPLEQAQFGPGESVGGFRGGVEIPEILKPPAKRRRESLKDADDDGDDEAYDEEYEGAGDGTYEGAYDESADDGSESESRTGARRWLSRLRRRGAQPTERTGPANPLLLLAAVLLVAGALFGYWLALAFGWLLAYGSRRLSRAEAKWAVAVLPGAAAAGGVVWLWGRVNGRWGEPIAEDGMREALTGTWPWVVRTAAIASALFLVWRARRR
ncbi:hypothetical protein AB0M39_25385, partial [Streptomyces sp. NPDC051907]|uniref:hypothetical protein n=1 Tax=Streptomyces sp. NPDC051907 TaxID=3155284 RepID=UPI003448DC07